MAKTNYKKLAVIQALQYVETRALNVDDFLKLIENLTKFYQEDGKLH